MSTFETLSRVKQFFTGIAGHHLNTLINPEIRRTPELTTTVYDLDMACKVYDTLVEIGVDLNAPVRMGSIERAFHIVKARELKAKGY